jgi:hypothetical protein
MMMRIPDNRSQAEKPATCRRPAAPCRGRTAALAAAALLLLAVLAAAGELGAPRIVLPEPKHDFGTVPAGRMVEHVFEIRNGGDAVLEIRKVQPT